MNLRCVETGKIIHGNAEFEYLIPDFFSLLGKNVQFTSPEFVYRNFYWRIYVQKSYDSVEMRISFRQNPLCSILQERTVYCIGIKQIDGTVYKPATCTVTSTEHWPSFENNRKFLLSDLQRDRMEITSHGNVRVFCYFICSKGEILGRTINSVLMQTEKINRKDVSTETDLDYLNEAKTESCLKDSPLELKKLSQDFKDLFLSESDSDVLIKVKEQEFKTHKAILRARSVVFRSMFAHNMQEESSSFVEITDCDPTAFREFLLYLYCSHVEFSESTVFDLYRMADKYDIQDLKFKCVKFMMDNITINTFFSVLPMSLQYNEPTLLKHATIFFMSNEIEILANPQWMTFLKKNPIEANELYLKSAKNKMSK